MKKLLKKIVSLSLVLCLTFGALTNLTGCSSKVSYITLGDWLTLINSTFHMNSYSTETPYFSNITSENSYFKEVQIATDWGVVDPKNPEINVDEKVTYKTACITLANASEICSATASEDEKINAAQKSIIPIREYFLDKNIKVDEAKEAADKAYSLWANKKYDGVSEKVEYLDGIKDLTSDSKAKNFTMNEDLIVVPTDDTSLKAGDTFVLPPNGTNLTVSAYKVKSVEYVDGKAYIQKEENVELTDVVEELQVAETYTPTLEKSVVYDGNGNLIYGAGGAIQADHTTIAKAKTSNLLAVKDNNGNYIDCGKEGSISSTFTVDGCEVTFKYDGSGIEAAVKMPFYTSSNDNTSINGTASFKVKDLKVTNDIDFSWFTLHSATVKVDYATETSFGISLKHKLNDGVYAPKYSNGNGKFISNLKRSVWKGSNPKGAKTIKICSINVASAGIASLCLDVNLNVTVEGSLSVKITESGSKGIEYKKGNLRLINVCDKDTNLEIKGKLEGTLGVGPAIYALGLKKPIIGVSAKIGVGAVVSATLHIADTENHLIEENTSGDMPPELYQDLESVNIAAEAQSIKSLAESQGCTYTTVTSGEVNLHCDVCTEVSAYFILRVGLDDKSFVGGLIGGSVKTTWEILGANNCRLLTAHIDNFNWSQGSIVLGDGTPACTLKYKPFDKLVTPASNTVAATTKSSGSGSTTSKNSNSGNPIQNSISADNLEISTLEITTNPGKTVKLTVTGVPEGYSANNVIFRSDDPTIATVDSSGNITAIANGVTSINVSIPNGVKSVTCAVNVVSDETINFSPIGRQYQQTK